MIQYYFAPNAEMMWAEIQWTGWLFDGGVPLWIAYGLAILIALWISWRIAIDKRVGDFGVWAALICAYNVAAGAVTFSYPLFNGQGGMEFWVLNACLYTAYLAIRKVPAQRGVEIATPEARPT